MSNCQTNNIKILCDGKPLSIRLHEASPYISEQNCYWIVNLTIDNGIVTVPGWAFVEPEYIELRFETWPAMEPPRFLSGLEPELSFEENSLAAIAETSEVYLDVIETAIRDLLNCCLFCVRTLIDSSDGIDRHHGMSFKYDGKVYFTAA